MAKAKVAPYVDNTGDPAKWAAEVLRLRFDEAHSFAGASATPDNIDAIHDMRVASRRFRTALRDFQQLLDKKHFKTLKIEMKNVADALGVVRDQDVAIEALHKISERSPNDIVSAGIDRLTAKHRDLRIERFEALKSSISLSSMARVKGLLEKALATAESKQNFVAFSISILDRSLSEFLELSDAIHDPLKTEDLHRLRIASKRLRYALELFDASRGGELRPFAKQVSRLQSALGTVHDSDEWIERLTATGLDESSDRETIDFLIGEFTNQRAAAYTEALETWNEFDETNQAENLKTIFDKGLGENPRS